MRKTIKHFNTHKTLKITFILPAIGKKPNEKYIRTWKMAPLTVSMLKALTPKEFDTEFFDDRIEDINFETATDLIAISIETYTAKRSYTIADEFRKRGKTIVFGGFHATLFPDEVKQHADSIVTGNAEKVWAQLLDDFKNNKLQPVYHGGLSFSNLIQDYSIFEGKKYLPLSLVETGRGCPHNCEFCAITAFYNCKYQADSIERVIAEIKNAKHKHFFFVDDNLTANPKFAIELFKAIKPFKIKWAGQGTLAMAKNKELLKVMKESGCFLMLIGFESLDEKNLKQMSKEWRTKIGEQDELVQAIHKAGINIYATFVFGFDNDTQQSVETALKFAMKHRFFLAAFNHLLPFPGTRLYKRLQNDKCLIEDNWWLSENYTYGNIVFRPKLISAHDLSIACYEARLRFFSVASVIKRGLALFKRKTPLIVFLQYWLQSYVFRKEVSQKMGLPMGKNLDEQKR